MSFNAIIEIIRGLRHDMKTLVTTLQVMNKSLGTLNKAIETMSKLQGTLEELNKKFPVIEKMVVELAETNENVKGMLDVIKALKEE